MQIIHFGGVNIITNQIDLSVIIPCYNSDRFIAETIQAAYSALLNLSSEIIVVNDGSTDLSESIIDKYSFVTKINIPNSGVSVARNTGAQFAKGRYFLFCDADDLLLETAFKDINNRIFESSPGVLYGDYLIFGPSAGGMPIPRPVQLKAPGAACQILEGVWRPSASYLIRRDIFFRTGMFNPFLSVVADCNFYFKLFFVVQSDFIYLAKPISLYRKNIIGQSMATNNITLFLYDCLFNASEAKYMWLKTGALSKYQSKVLFSCFDFVGREAYKLSNIVLVRQCGYEIFGLGFWFPPFNSYVSKISYFLFGFSFLLYLRTNLKRIIGFFPIWFSK